ncbi:hypothetical protein [Streptomyces sp. NPDC002758]
MAGHQALPGRTDLLAAHHVHALDADTDSRRSAYLWTRGSSVSAVVPGTTLTEMIDDWDAVGPGIVDRLTAQTPLGRTPPRRRSPRPRSGCSAGGIRA